MYLLGFLKGERLVTISETPLLGTAQEAILFLRLTLGLLLACITLGMGSAAAAEAKTFKDCPDCPEMVVIPPGSFTMGSRSLEAGHHDNETPLHKVKVASFAMAKTHITVEQFSRFVKETGYDGGKDCYQFGAGKSGSWSDPGFKQMPNHPVTCVNWNDAKAYTDWLAHKTGKSYRLPSEAEWEYAARAGTTTIYYWGDDIGKGNANCGDCGSQWDGVSTSPVGSFAPNAFGLYDMLGNAWQWVEDKMHDSYLGAPTDGSPWTTGASTGHILRGGAFNFLPLYDRAAIRFGDEPASRSYYFGFRVAQTLQ